MATNAIHADPGTIVHTPSAEVLKNAPRIIGKLIGVAITTVPANQPGAFAVKGVHTLPKATGFAPGQGDALIFDSATNAFVAAATTGDIVGGAVAWKAAGSSDTTVEAWLLPGCGVIEPSGG